MVEEIPAFSFSGSGDHWVIKIKKVGLSTLEVIKKLSQIFKIPEKEIGYLGMKDVDAVAYQYISLPARCDVGKIDMEGVEVLDVSRHKEKLRVGRLAGNRFAVILRHVDDVDSLIEGIKKVEREGFPNFFDEQRFSSGNLEKGLRLLKGEKLKVSPYLKRLFVSAVSSWVFNVYLKRRMELGMFPDPVEGDLVVDEDSDYWCPLRFAEGDKLIPTGPIPGYKMPLPEGRALELERKVLAECEMELDAFRPFKSKGSRRPILAFPEDLKVEILGKDRLKLTFFLKRGSYATCMLKWLQAP